MNLVQPSRWRAAITGFLLGAMTWHLVTELGMGQLIGVTDLGALGIAGVVGAVLGFFRRSAILWWISAVALLLIFAIGWTQWIAPQVESTVRADSLPAAGVDAIVVLSSDLSPSGTISTTGADRLESGVELLNRNVAHRIITTRITRRFGIRTVVSDDDQRRILRLATHPPEHTVIDSVHSTHDEALRIAAFALPMGWKYIALVTSPLHTKRACATFERVGFLVTCVPSISRDLSWHQLRGPTERVRAFEQWLYERLGWWKYQLKGWV